MNPMRRNNRNYSYQSLSSRTIAHQLNNQQSSQPLTAPTTPLHPKQQYQSQSLTAISDLAEPMSVFDDLKFPPERQTAVTPFPPVYLSPRQAPVSDSRLATVSDPRLATVSAMRERLLVDIQLSMKEVDREITSLEERSIILRYNPSPFSSVITSRQSSFEKYSNNQLWPKKSRKVYSVVPRIASQPKKTSASVASTRSNKIVLPSYIGKYHYGPETAENVIRDGDPENSELKLVTKEIPKLELRQPINLDKLRREQSGVPQNRALIFVPQYDDKSEIGFNEKLDDLQQSYLIDSDTARISTVLSSRTSPSTNRISIQNFQLFTHTAPKPKVEIIPKSPPVLEKAGANLISSMVSSPVTHASPEPKSEIIPKSPAVSEKVEANLISSMVSSPVTHASPEPKPEIIPKSPAVSVKAKSNLITSVISSPVTHKVPTPKGKIISKSPAVLNKIGTNLINPMLSAPVKHVREAKKPDKSHSPSLQITKQISEIDTTHFFSDYGNGAEGEEDLISIDPGQFILPVESENLTDDNLSGTLIGQSQISILNSHSLQDQPSLITYNDGFQERETKTPDAITAYTTTPNSILPSNNAFLLPIADDMQTQHVNRSQKDEALTTISNDDTIPQTPDSQLGTGRKASSKTMNSLQQRTLSIDHSSQNPSSYILSRGVSISSTDIHKTSIDSNRNSPLPVPLNSPDSTNVRPSTPQSITPERRNSISTFDQSSLLTPVDVSNLLDPPTNPSPLVNRGSLQENRSDTNRKETDDDEIFPQITASQRRSKLSLIIQRPKPKEKTPIDEPLPELVPQSDQITTQKVERRVAFAAEVTHEPVKESAPAKTWRERINEILSKERFPIDKYAHVKARVNTFENYEYRPKHSIVVPKKKTRRNKKRTSPIQVTPPPKRLTPQVLGRIQRSPDGRPVVFHEKLNWKSPSKLRSYSLANLKYKPHESVVKIPNETLRWHSESRVSKLIKRTPISQTRSLPNIPDDSEPSLVGQSPETEMKIFDVQQSSSKFQESLFSDSSWNSKRSDKIISNGKLVWKKESKLKDAIWENINYKPKKSTVQIFHKPVHWNRQSKIQVTNSLTLAKYWSETDLHQLKKQKSLFYQYRNLKWNDIVTTDNEYSFVSLTQDYSEDENFNEKSPANRPKWNAVSKSRSLNLIYNPKVVNSNLIRRGWDLDLRRKRVHKLPPLKRKRVQNEVSQLAIEAPPATTDENYSQVLTTEDQRTSTEYAVTPSRRSSKALVPLIRVPDLPILSETPRSQRPVQQEWYDELSKSHSTHRAEVVRTRHNSFQDSNLSFRRTITPRDFRSSTRNSQTSVVSSVLLDSSIRTNRATELRLSRDMDEHHQHCHDPSQSMPFEIRGFRLEGTQLSVPDNTTIRPLSNVSYHTSERVKSRRLYPWGTPHPNGTLSRNSMLLPITELRHPSFNSSTLEIPQLIQEE